MSWGSDKSMLSVAFLGRLRNTLLWPYLQRIHRWASPRLCTATHALVQATDPDLLPDDLVLKHTYDYQVIYLAPGVIERSLRVGEWLQLGLQAETSRISRILIWLRLGGGWKNLQRNLSRNVHGRFVASGDWDLYYEPFVIQQTIIDLFVDGRAPEETAEYQKMRRWVETGEFGWSRGCRTIEDVDQYFAELVDVYETIRAEGYRNQIELGNDGADEIRVCIDREGRPCVFGGGTHRLSIAQLLGISRIPVLVKRVHPQWVRSCQAVHGQDVHVAVARGLEALQSGSTSSSPDVNYGFGPEGAA